MRKFTLLAVVFIMLGTVFALGSFRVAAFDPLGGACSEQQSGPGKTSPSACSLDNKAVDGPGILNKVITILSYVAGAAAVIMIIVSAVEFMTSGGDASKVAKARNALLAAVIGLIVVVLAQAILHFVISRTAPAASFLPSGSVNSTLQADAQATYGPAGGHALESYIEVMV